MPLSAYLSLFLVGLLGGLHCAGMCGGIVTVLSGNAGPVVAARRPVAIPIRAAGVISLPGKTALSYNAGRLTSYMVAGALAGAVGSVGWVLANLLPVQQAAFVVANGMLIVLGMSLLIGARWTSAIERAGDRFVGGLWRRSKPAAVRALSASVGASAYCAGLLWGCVPCGMVYTALATALVSGNPVHGALLMLAFGLGTLPNLLGLGWLAGRAGTLLVSSRLRKAAGILIVGFGLLGMFRLDPFEHLHALAALCLTPLHKL